MRMKQEEFEREEASMRPADKMSARSRALLQKKGQIAAGVFGIISAAGNGLILGFCRRKWWYCVAAFA